MSARKQTILATAYGMMGTKGLESVHARTVAAEVGINHATVHYYFPKRSDLLIGVADYAIGILEDDRKRFLEGASAPRERLAGEVSLAEAYSKKGSRFFKVLCGLFVASAQDPALKRKVKALWSAWADSISQASAGSVLPGDVVAACLFGLGTASQISESSSPARFAAFEEAIVGK